ncbi:MAG: dUTP diphosphatase [Rhodospirillaceae bacterium]|jgi:dUTP pyrophosphatase|nr:dUTP diphosphatase [Rhodospirillaceae bacterium]
MRIRIEKMHESAVIPKYANFGDACVDLVAIRKWKDEHGNHCYGTGLAMEIPTNHVGYIFPRSSIAKTSMALRNAVGVIDSGYRGEVIIKFGEIDGDKVEYKIGDRVAQFMIAPVLSINFLEVAHLPSSDRGSGGFGSSGS